VDAAKEKGTDLGDVPVLGQGCTKVNRLSWFWVKGAGRVARRLEKGMHGVWVPGLCDDLARVLG